MGLIYSHRKFSNLTGDEIRYMSPEVIKHLKRQGLKESNSQDVSYNSDLLITFTSFSITVWFSFSFSFLNEFNTCGIKYSGKSINDPLIL